VPWANLAEEIQEELSSFGLDFRDGLRLVNKNNSDPEAHKAYQRWYYRQVRYPKNKDEILEKGRLWREANRDKVVAYYKEWYRKNREAKLAKQKEARKLNPPKRNKEKAYVRNKAYMERLRSDPAKYEDYKRRNNKRNVMYRQRKKASKVKSALEYLRELDGKAATGSS
jgi:hypothetical protein